MQQSTQQQQQQQHQEVAQFQHLSENERRFIEFYTNMSSQQPHDSGRDFMELPCNSQLVQRQVETNKQQQQDVQTLQGAVLNQAGGSSPVGMTIVSPTQATVQQARKQAMHRAAMKVRRARKVIPRKKSMASKRKTKAPARKKATGGRKAARAKVQKKRAQRGAGRKKNNNSTRKSNKKAR